MTPQYASHVRLDYLRWIAIFVYRWACVHIPNENVAVAGSAHHGPSLPVGEVWVAVGVIQIPVLVEFQAEDAAIVTGKGG